MKNESYAVLLRNNIVYSLMVRSEIQKIKLSWHPQNKQSAMVRLNILIIKEMMKNIINSATIIVGNKILV